MKLNQFKALSFDCYGTLVDWESGMIEGLKPLTDRLDAPISRDEILQAHARHESSQQQDTPTMLYQDILVTVFEQLARDWGVEATPEECSNYGQSVRNWPVFEDSVKALKYLKQHYKLIILSNIDNRSFAYSNAKLDIEFDAIYTAQDVGAYKPSDLSFHYLVDNIGSLGLTREDLLHTAESMFHDHVPANKFGIANCWIYRRHAQEGYGATMVPGNIPNVDYQFNSMAELVSAHRKLVV